GRRRGRRRRWLRGHLGPPAVGRGPCRLVAGGRRGPAPDRGTADDVLRLPAASPGAAGGVDLPAGCGGHGASLAGADRQVLGMGGPGPALPRRPLLLAGTHRTAAGRYPPNGISTAGAATGRRTCFHSRGSST